MFQSTGACNIHARTHADTLSLILLLLTKLRISNIQNLSATLDIFGRERFATDRDDMGGIGTFSRENRTLYIGRVRLYAFAKDTYICHMYRTYIQIMHKHAGVL
jgi:hypothetical protein